MDPTPQPLPTPQPARPTPAPAPTAKVHDPVAGPASGDGPTIDEASGAAAVHLSIWQHPFVQNIVPLLSSLLLHGGIILFAILTYKVVKIVSHPTVDQVVIPDPGIAEKKNNELAAVLQGGSTGDAATDGIMAAGPLTSFNKGRGAGGGQGDNGGAGSGDNSGALAAFGVPGGGGGIGPKTKFFGVSGRARRIVFVLDATGSMYDMFD